MNFAEEYLEIFISESHFRENITREIEIYLKKKKKSTFFVPNRNLYM